MLACAAALWLSAPAPATGPAPAGPHEPGPPDSAQAPADTVRVRPSLSGRLIKLLSDYVVAQPPDSLGEELVPAEEPFRAHQGARIRRIEIVQLDMFSGMPGTADRPPDTFLERTARRLHRETRRTVIRQYLLMKEGDALDPFTLADTERILRGTAFLQDARIEVVPVIGQEGFVDLLVVTRDVWSIGFSLPIDRVDELRLRFFERNLLGYGHDVEYRTWIDTATLARSQWEVRYRVGNVLGKFLRVELALGDQETERWQRVSLGRSPVAPQIHLAGALLVENIGRKDVENDVPGSYRERFDRVDGWLGYNLALGRNAAGGPGRVALFPAIRATWTDFRETPPDRSLASLAYQDRFLLLGGTQVGRSEYRKTRLVYEFGETEDIAVGYRFGAAAGEEFGSTVDRDYLALQAGGFGDLGLPWWVGGGVDIGAYRRGSVWEDGVVRTRLRGFSGLGRAGPFRWRHFADLQHTAGIRRRDENDLLVLDRKTGVRGLRDSGLADRQRAALNLESVGFTPWALLGFKIAIYGFCDIGAVAPDLAGFSRARYYQSLGLGLRLRNERLVFDTVDLQLAFIPSPPEDSDVQTVRFRNPAAVPADLWQVGPPQLIEYR
jgi:hypothetical protein